MRLRRLDLARYGKFTDTTIDFGEKPAGEPDLHLVYGLNESGKSTSLAAYLDLLFGIEDRSRYSFLHEYAAMRIGAVLELGGVPHSLVRIKQRHNSLLDGNGQPLDEAPLSVSLAGLSREAYQTMFSLDDDSLERGGEAIIESKGDLGRLLFSASAGLGAVSQTLTAIGEEAGAIYKKGARTSTRLAQLKQQLAELKTRREGLDTLVSVYANLVAQHGQAASAYQQAIAARAEARGRHDDLEARLAALPLVDERAAVLAELEGLQHLATPPAGWSAELPRFAEDDTRLETQLSALLAERERVQHALEALPADAGLLALAGRMQSLSDGRARYLTAEKDLPNRRIALIERDAALGAILASLDRTGTPDPARLLLPAALVGALRDLIEARSGIDAALAGARREFSLAEDNLRAAEGEAQAREDTALISEQDEARLDRAVREVRASTHGAAFRLALRARDAAGPRCSAELAALAPWVGDGAALDAMAVPDPRQLAIWRTALEDAARRRATAAQRLDELDMRMGEDRARHAEIARALEAVDDGAARATRAARDAAWSAHSAALDQTTATAFEAAMRADDALREARLFASRDLAELRQIEQALAAASAAAEHQRKVRDEAARAADVVRAEIVAAIPPGLNFAPDRPAEQLLASLEAWMARRESALGLWAEVKQAEADIADARSVERDLGARLSLAMADAGVSQEPAADLPSLLEAAETALAGQARSRALLDAQKKHRADCVRDLAQRRRALEEAEAERSAWQERWDTAMSRAWFGESGASLGAVRHILDALSRLGPAIAERDDLARRVAQMEGDQRRFAADLAEALATLGETLDEKAVIATADALARRVERAGRDHEAREHLEAEAARLEANRAELDATLVRHRGRKGEMLAFFGVTSLSDVARALDALRVRAGLEARLADLETRLVMQLGAPDIAAAEAELAGLDRSALKRERDELRERLEDMEGRARQLFSELTRAEDRLDAVGGDSAVARLDAQRRTLLLEIEDKAIEHLRLKLGVLAAERALGAYRERHRSSMMKRASDAFRLITRGQYRGLAAQPDRDGETLIGVPSQGGSKVAGAMSKGTRFQLYLALRLAGYYEFAEHRASVPFIADDIMETFDEPRSEEVLRLFAHMARVGQVIYLTHHRHLCDLARALVPGVRIHELG